MAIIRDKARKYMLEPHLEWAEGHDVPLPEAFAIEMLAVDTKPRAEIGARGAISHLKGRDSFLTRFSMNSRRKQQTQASEALQRYWRRTKLDTLA